MGNFHAMLEGDCCYQNVGFLIRHFLLGFHGSLTQTLLKGSISSVLAAQPRLLLLEEEIPLRQIKGAYIVRPHSMGGVRPRL